MRACYLSFLANSLCKESSPYQPLHPEHGWVRDPLCKPSAMADVLQRGARALKSCPLFVPLLEGYFIDELGLFHGKARSWARPVSQSRARSLPSCSSC
eukprot:6385040-Amphidinium_carterae.1